MEVAFSASVAWLMLGEVICDVWNHLIGVVIPDESVSSVLPG